LMATRESRSHAGEASSDAKSMVGLRLDDFALLDKVLLLEASVKQSAGVPDRVRDRLLHQLAALKDDLRVVCMVLVGEAPARTGAVPLPVWARSDERRSAASRESSDAG
jgi:hypothetical protein